MAETTNLITALSKAQGSFTTVSKEGKGNYGTYVKLDTIHEMALPVLAANGLAWITLPTYDESGEPILEYKLLHTSGETIEGKMRMYVSQPNSQQMGSAITYARRYAICAVLGIVGDEDDDGQSATSAPAKPYVKKPVQTTSTAPITDDQLKSIVGLLERKGLDHEQIGKVLTRFALENFKKDSIKAIDASQYMDLNTTISSMDQTALKNLAKGE